MKVHLVIAITGSLVMAAVAKSDVALNVEYEVPISSLKSVADALEQGGDGPNVVPVQSAINVGCAAGKPDASGNGCEVLFSSEGGPQLGIIGLKIKKPVVKEAVLGVYRRALASTTASDPNRAGGDLEFGNPLSSDDAAERTHYYCSARGEAGNKAWKCYLSVSETLGHTVSR